MAALLAVLSIGTACGHSPTTPSPPPVTWTIAPTSVGQSSFGEFEQAGHLEVGSGKTLFDKPTMPANGDCTVTLVKAYRYGRMLFSVVEPVYKATGPEVQTDIQATIDVEP